MLHSAPLSPEYVPALTRLVNWHLGQVPSGLPLTEEQVERALAEEPFWSRHYPEDTRRMESETVCLLEDGRLIGAAGEEWHPRGAALEAGVDPAWAQAEEWRYVPWLVADPDHAAAADRLVALLVERAAEERRGVRLSSRYRFGIGWNTVPSTWPHVLDALRRRGFRETQRWTSLFVGTDASIEHTPPPGFELRWHVDEAACEWELRAFDGETMAGECQVWDVPDGARSAGRHPWTVVEYLEVAEPYRRRGLGQFLLQEQRRVQATRGVRHLLLWTDPDDPDTAAARRLYARLGFTPGPDFLQFERPPT